MMVVDSSALVAIVMNEADASFFTDKLTSVAISYISAANWLETSMVIAKRFPENGIQRLDDLIKFLRIILIPVSTEQVIIARQAFLRYGEGNHAAALNFGDCFAYALAKESGEPLLCKGDDFKRTDITMVAY